MLHELDIIKLVELYLSIHYLIYLITLNVRVYSVYLAPYVVLDGHYSNLWSPLKAQVISVDGMGQS